MADSKRKHNELSSTSSLDTSQDTSFTQKEHKQSKGKKKKKAKQDKKEKELFLTVFESEEPENKPVKIVTTEENIDMEHHIAEINKKLTKVLTREDDSFLKSIIKETIIELKDEILSSVIHRLEIVESEVHEKALENTELKQEIENLTKKIKEKEQETETLKTSIQKEVKQETIRVNKVLNDHEQYSRRNNVRIFKLPGDYRNEQSMETTYKVLDMLNQTMELDLTPQSIDIAHRLGPYKNGRNRHVIVKFVHRQTTHMILYKRNMLKGTGIAIYEDLTPLNSEVLASTRKKLPDQIEQSWYKNGNIFTKSKVDGTITQLKFKDYQGWIDLDWPENQKNHPTQENADSSNMS